jgi:cytochrome c553
VSLQLQRKSQKVRSYLLLLCVLTVVAAGTPSAAPSGSEPPAWAYVVPPPDAKPAHDNGKIRRVPKSTAGYTLKEVTDRFAAPDWHPEDHPKMPEIVAHGRKPEVNACGYCHRADGPGGPENASLAGLPYDYILEQMADYKSGKRSTALPKRLPQANMIALAKASTDEEIQAAAKYFSSLKPRQNIRVVETARVPKTYVAGWVLAAKVGKTKEPLGRRVVETPEDLERFESRDTRATFVAYVPIGSLREGEAIVRGDRVGPPCATCHGKDLHGRELAPAIAGRSPSYIVRQLYEMQTGVRTGSGVMLMKAAVARLSPDEMIDVAAYLASLKP